jgi:hypothetical protein
MNYIEPVTFSTTGNYGCGPKNEDDVYTVEEFKEIVELGAFIDYDGYGHPVKNKLADISIIIKPSNLSLIPSDATHIIWYNR